MVANHPQLRLDAGLLDEVIEGQIGKISELVRWRLVLRRGAEQRPEWRTTGHELLAGLLREKQSLATERLFRTLGLRHRQEDLAQIYQGLRNESTRDSSLELLHGVLPKGLRETVLALVDGEQDAERAGGVSADAAETPQYESLVAALARDDSIAVRCLASYHAAEIGLAQESRGAEERPADRWDWLADLRQRSLDLLSFRPGPAGEGVAGEG